MRLSVGAVSRRVVEEAAKLQVHQIVASRRQVDIGSGYTGLDQEALADLVYDLSDNKTDVVRDHGGPLQGPDVDDGVDSLDADFHACFHTLHLDVSKLPRDEQVERLRFLIDRYPGTGIEIGGERDDQSWLEYLVAEVGNQVEFPEYAIIQAGGHIWNGKQIGNPHDVEYPEVYARYGFNTKAHNFDWCSYRTSLEGIDCYNVAPEFSQVETTAWLNVMSNEHAGALMTIGYNSGAWRRWFRDGEMTDIVTAAKIGIPYILEQADARQLLSLYEDQEDYVRKEIRDAIVSG